jgi:hypothetical protein
MPRPLIALKRFYSGSDVEQAWRALHRVQAVLYTMYLLEELTPQAEHVEAVIAELPAQAALLKLATKLVPQIKAEASPGQAAPVTKPGTILRGIYERAMDVSDNLQREARGLRNALVVASIVTFIVLVSLGVAHAIDKSIIDLCITETGSMKMACPIGESPHPFDVFAIELAGMLGGLLSIIIPLATGERIKTPYRVFNQQLVPAARVQAPRRRRERRRRGAPYRERGDRNDQTRQHHRDSWLCGGARLRPADRHRGNRRSHRGLTCQADAHRQKRLTSSWPSS